MSFAQLLDADRRLVMLRILAEQTGQRANSSVLAAALDHFGHAVSRDYTKTHLRWLQEQGLVAVDDVGPVLVATLTERGADVSRGLAQVDGVSVPGA